MFYCEDCRVKRGWPEAFSFSRGSCECCGKNADCHDRPAGSLPAPLPSTKLPTVKDPKLPEPIKVLRAGDFIIRHYSGPNDPRVWLENMQGEAVEVRLEDLWEKLFEKGGIDGM